jgi:hypothetical protein
MPSSRNSRQTNNKPNNRFDYWKFSALVNKYFRRLSEGKSSQNETESRRHYPYMKYGTWSERIATIVNIALAVFTYLLLRQATTQNEAALTSANAAIETVKLMKSADTNNRANFSRSLDQTKEALKLQHTAIQSTQKQFEISNEAYLQITDAKVTRFFPGQPLGIELQISNYGNYVAKIKEARCGIHIKKVAPDYQSSIKQISMLTMPFANVIISKDFPTTRQGSNDFILPEQLFNAANQLSLNVFVSGYVKYVRMIDNTPKTYNFQLEIPLTNEYFKYVINENRFD